MTDPINFPGTAAAELTAAAEMREALAARDLRVEEFGTDACSALIVTKDTPATGDADFTVRVSDPDGQMHHNPRTEGWDGWWVRAELPGREGEQTLYRSNGLGITFTEDTRAAAGAAAAAFRLGRARLAAIDAADDTPH